MSKEIEDEINTDENEGLFSEEEELIVDKYNESLIVYDIIKEITKECIFPVFDLLCVEDISVLLEE
jgi:hypothetical protein